jgi:hypothetical protein
MTKFNSAPPTVRPSHPDWQPCHIPTLYLVPLFETRGAKTYETKLRYCSCGPGCSRPIRGLVYAVLR